MNVPWKIVHPSNVVIDYVWPVWTTAVMANMGENVYGCVSKTAIYQTIVHSMAVQPAYLYLMCMVTFSGIVYCIVDC